MSLLLYHWYPGSGVVLDCFDSLTLSSFLLYLQYDIQFQNKDFQAFILFGIHKCSSPTGSFCVLHQYFEVERPKVPLLRGRVTSIRLCVMLG